MVKSFREPTSPALSKEKKDKLLQIMDSSKISLLRAAQLLDIPYTTAKQILFVSGTPKKRRERSGSDVTSYELQSVSTTPKSAMSVTTSPTIKESWSPTYKHSKTSSKKVDMVSKPRAYKIEKKPRPDFCYQCSECSAKTQVSFTNVYH